MTTETQNRAIAVAAGYKPVGIKNGFGHEILTHATNGEWIREQDLPQYTEDLNAMHDAEKVIESGDHKRLYFDWLGRLATLGATTRECATAAQRAEAFLRTFNLWEDDIPANEKSDA